MGTKGPKAGNIFTSLRSRGLVGNQGQDPSIKGMGSAAKFNSTLEKKAQKGELPAKFAEAVMANKSGGSPFKQTKDGSDASLYGKARAAVVGAVDAAGGVKGMAKNMVKSMQTQLTSLGQGNRHMDGPAPTPPSKNSKAVLESEKKGDEAINDKMKAGPKKKNHKY